MKLWCSFFRLEAVALLCALASEAFALDWQPLPAHEDFRVGDEIEITLSQEHPEYRLGGELSDLQKSGIRVLEAHERSLLLGLIKPGELELKALPLFSEKGEKVSETAALTFTVKSVLEGQATKAEPPLPPERLPFPTGLVMVLGALVALILGFAIYGLVKWTRKNRKIKPVPVKLDVILPPHEVAFALLNDLESQRLLQKAQYKLYYFKISEIMKAYLGSKYSFLALESTSGELLAGLREKGAPEKIQNLSLSLFSDLDPVKFTDVEPDPARAAKILELARALVKESLA